MQLYNRKIESEHREGDFEDSGSQPEGLELDAVLGIIRRQWIVVAIGVVAAAVIGLAYVLTAVPLYTSRVSVLIDRSNSQVVQQLSTIGSVLDDEGSVLSQVEVLRSDTIAYRTIDRLDLTNNPQFMATDVSFMSTVSGALKSVTNLSQWFVSEEVLETDASDDRRQAALNKILANSRVSRVGKTYVLVVAYTSPSPQLSALIANGIGDAYLVDKLDSKYEATRRASGWLQDRIAELRQKALETDLAVQRFRSDNGLVAAGSMLISDQQLSELNTALIVAQSDTAKARARLQQIEKILADGDTNAIVTDVLDSSISNDLRKSYLDASKLEAEISMRLGPDHAQAVRLRNEMDQYRRLLLEELSRIAQSYRSDVNVAESREQTLEQSVAAATGVSALANETKVQLRELEREAETYRNLYQTFLQRYQEAVQQQSFPVTDTRIISPATPAKNPSYPRKPLVLALFCVLGAAAGGAFGGYREFRDRFFRTEDQVRQILQMEFLGTTPIVKKPSVATAVSSRYKPDELHKTSSISDYVVENPLSGFAETMRSAKIAAEHLAIGQKCKIIGVISALPGEGKSTIAINFAELLATQGLRTVLIDADLRNPGATRAIGQHSGAGLLEALLENRDPRMLLLKNSKTGLSFLPAIIKHRVPHSSELLTSPAMTKVLSSLCEDHDYLILDLPPLGPVVDARAIARQVDGFLLVVEWGRTARRVVKQILGNVPQVREKCLGVVLNKVDQDKMKLYRAYGSSEYYSSRYLSYYQTENK